MAARGSAPHRAQGNPLGGVLRELGRQSRAATTARQGRSRAAPAGERGERGERGKPGPRGEPGTTVLAAVVTTGGDGRASWTWETPLLAPPVISALAAGGREDGAALTVVLEEVTAAGVTVRVWRSRPVLRLEVLMPSSPVGAGVDVHVTATPASGPNRL
ncbi:hypothetical protein ACH4RG_22950 [Streptomyces sp. NPDC021019]|uniref:hypothetical protein n=1 Tax=Streptomyces sp. NPDC021019 TaxID=3365108 RepID=UPI003795D36E